MKLVSHVDIDAPASLIFEWITEGDRVCRWVATLESDEVIEQVDGHVGTRFRQVFDHHGKRTEMEGEVLAWEADRRVKIHLTSPKFEMTLEMTIEPVRDGLQRVTQHADIRMKGCMKVLVWVLAPVMREQAKQHGERDLRELRRLCEAEAARGVTGRRSGDTLVRSGARHADRQ